MKQKLFDRFLLVALAMSLPASLLAQQIVLDDTAVLGALVLRDGGTYNHLLDNNVVFNTNEPRPWLLGYFDDGDSFDTSGIYGDDDSMTIWNPGDAVGAPSSPPKAYLYVLDEDLWGDHNGDPYDAGALKAYLDTSGLWQTSDRSRKTNFAQLDGALARVRALNGYTYEFVMSDQEVAKGQVAKGLADGQVLPQRRAGLVAQELALVLPEAVASNAYGEMWVNYSQVVPLLIEAIKEQQVLIDELSAKQSALEGRWLWSH